MAPCSHLPFENGPIRCHLSLRVSPKIVFQSGTLPARTLQPHWRCLSRARPVHAGQGSSTRISAPEAIPELTAEDGNIPKSFSIDLLDRVITIFREHKPEDWRKLIAFSKMWKHMSSSVFNRISAQAAAAGACNDVDEAAALRRLSRRLRTVNDEVEQYVSLIKVFRETPASQWESLVTRHRPTLTRDFFSQVELMFAAAGAWEDKEAGKAEQAELSSLRTQVAALVTAYDAALATGGALAGAKRNLRDLLSSKTMQEADSKIDSLAESGKLDPATVLALARAYNGVNESQYVKEDAKEVMAHLYFRARETYFSQAPPEIRILKYLLTVRSPRDRENLIEAAFQPDLGLISDPNVDMLSTTPQKMLRTLNIVLQLWEKSLKGAHIGDSDPSSLESQSAKLMKPKLIKEIESIAATIRRKYT